MTEQAFSSHIMVALVFLVSLSFKHNLTCLSQKPDPKKIQIYVIGFLGKNAERLISELWDLLLEAQETGSIPKSLLEEKRGILSAKLVSEEGGIVLTFRWKILVSKKELPQA